MYLGVAVIVDVDLVEDVVVELVEVRAAGRRCSGMKLAIIVTVPGLSGLTNT